MGAGKRIGFAADAKSRMLAHSLPRHWEKTFLCESCLAQKPNKKADPVFTFMNFEETAPWRSTMLTHEQYVRLEPAGAISPYFRIHGIGLHTLFKDLLHGVFLGFGRDLGASSLFFWARNRSLAVWVGQFGLHEPTEDQMFEMCFKYFRRWCREYKLCKIRPSINPFTLSSMGRKKDKNVFPAITSKVKAIALKVMLQFLAHLANEIACLVQSDDNDLLNACLYSLV
eukprot:8553612-Pyramimonas_sp.AAC.1